MGKPARGEQYRWLPQRDASLRWLFLIQKLPVEIIAERLGTTVDSLRVRKSRLGMRRGLFNRGAPWTADATAALIARRRAGLTYRAIGAEMNRSIAAVKKRLVKLRKENKL